MKAKPNIISIEVHPQLSSDGHLVDGVLMGASSLWLFFKYLRLFLGGGNR